MPIFRGVVVSGSPGSGKTAIILHLVEQSSFGKGEGLFQGKRQRDGEYKYSRGHTFGDFVTIRTEASMQDITDSPLYILNVMYCVRVSLWTVKIFLAQH
jgi:hypothetical protein